MIIMFDLQVVGFNVSHILLAVDRRSTRRPDASDSLRIFDVLCEQMMLHAWNRQNFGQPNCSVKICNIETPQRIICLLLFLRRGFFEGAAVDTEPQGEQFLKASRQRSRRTFKVKRRKTVPGLEDATVSRS